MTEFSPPHFDASVRSPLHPFTPRGVVVEKDQHSTFSTFLHPPFASGEKGERRAQAHRDGRKRTETGASGQFGIFSPALPR
jgi:hypothetical protein